MVREERSAMATGSCGGTAAEAELGSAAAELHEHVTLHLLPADLSLDEFRRYGSYMTLCGQRVPAHDLPDSECPPGCEGDPYCRKCTRVAAEVLGLVAEQLGVSR